MCKSSSIILCFFLSVFSLIAEGKNRVVLKDGEDLQHQLVSENTIYIVNSFFELQGRTIVLPERSELRFVKGGCLANGAIVGNNTRLSGSVKLFCKLKGCFLNAEIPVSWLNLSDKDCLSEQVASILNLTRPCTLIVNQDIQMNESVQEVAYVKISGKGKITNSISFRVLGNVSLENVCISGFDHDRELFIDFRDIKGAVNVTIKNISFDGNNRISRFLYCQYKSFPNVSSINISGSTFRCISNYVVHFQSPCTGSIQNNNIESIGTNKLSNVIALHLGDSDHSSDRLNAKCFNITNNIFKNFLVPYSDVHNGREAHAILIYGNNNIIKTNRVENFHTEEPENNNTGLDGEGIYLKGGGNVIEDNYLEDCIGASPDGAITVKMTKSTKNVIKNNVIKHKYGIGIQCYTPHSIIERNKIYSKDSAETCIGMLNNSNTVLKENELFSDGSKVFHAGIVLRLCDNITIEKNYFSNTSGILTAYQCTGTIVFNKNSIDIKDKDYGKNTYFSAPFYFSSDAASFYLKKNVINIDNLKSSQLIEAPVGFKGGLVIDSNIISISNKKKSIPAFTYLIRNIERYTIKRNRNLAEQGIIEKISNMPNEN